MFNPRSFTRRLLALTTVTAVAIAAAACTIDSAAEDHDGQQQEQTEETTQDKPKDKAPEISVKDGATDVDPSELVTVTSQGEGLEEVTMVNESGYVVEEKLSDDGMEWSTDEVLGYNRTYTLTAVDENGKEKDITFSTMEASATADVALSPTPGSEVGVGQVIAVRFGAYVNDREAAEEAIKVETSPEVEGAFYWVNGQEVRWRPQYYWEPGTEVSVKVDLYGTDLGGGVMGGSDAETNFTIGDRVVSIVDNATKTMKVYRNQKLLREIPVSLGRDGQWDTPNGRYIIGDEHEQLLMDSSTFGLAKEDGGYETLVDYATQMSYSGIYVHAAPWSVWAQGNTNTSHGCINVTTEAAAWFQDVVKRGDIVRVKNTNGGTLNPLDGLGDWNMSWKQWSKGNADENQ
ncbi:L,D-transpeptidase [Corynebacterium camporealensis]